MAPKRKRSRSPDSVGDDSKAAEDTREPAYSPTSPSYEPDSPMDEPLDPGVQEFLDAEPLAVVGPPPPGEETMIAALITVSGWPWVPGYDARIYIRSIQLGVWMQSVSAVGDPVKLPADWTFGPDDSWCVIAEINGPEGSNLRYTSNRAEIQIADTPRKAWAAAAFLLAFTRANRGHTFADSCIALVPSILALGGLNSPGWPELAEPTRKCSALMSSKFARALE